MSRYSGQDLNMFARYLRGIGENGMSKNDEYDKQAVLSASTMLEHAITMSQEIHSLISSVRTDLSSGEQLSIINEAIEKFSDISLMMVQECMSSDITFSIKSLVGEPNVDPEHVVIVFREVNYDTGEIRMSHSVVPVASYLNNDNILAIAGADKGRIRFLNRIWLVYFTSTSPVDYVMCEGDDQISEFYMMVKNYYKNYVIRKHYEEKGEK